METKDVILELRTKSGLSQEALDAKLAVTLAGEAYERGLSLVVEDGKAVLKNLKPTGTIFYLR